MVALFVEFSLILNKMAGIEQTFDYTCHVYFFTNDVGRQKFVYLTEKLYVTNILNNISNQLILNL